MYHAYKLEKVGPRMSIYVWEKNKGDVYICNVLYGLVRWKAVHAPTTTWKTSRIYFVVSKVPNFSSSAFLVLKRSAKLGLAYNPLTYQTCTREHKDTNMTRDQIVLVWPHTNYLLNGTSHMLTLF